MRADADNGNKVVTLQYDWFSLMIECVLSVHLFWVANAALFMRVSACVSLNYGRLGRLYAFDALYVAGRAMHWSTDCHNKISRMINATVSRTDAEAALAADEMGHASAHPPQNEDKIAK